MNMQVQKLIVLIYDENLNILNKGISRIGKIPFVIDLY